MCLLQDCGSDILNKYSNTNTGFRQTLSPGPRNLVTIFWNLIVQSLKHNPHCECEEYSQELTKDQVEKQEQTSALGVFHELSIGLVVDEELPLGQALVEGLLVLLCHGVCAYCEGRGGGSTEVCSGSSSTAPHCRAYFNRLRCADLGQC